jgi:hypothetical protein
MRYVLWICIRFALHYAVLFGELIIPGNEVASYTNLTGCPYEWTLFVPKWEGKSSMILTMCFKLV